MLFKTKVMFFGKDFEVEGELERGCIKDISSMKLIGDRELAPFFFGVVSENVKRHLFDELYAAINKSKSVEATPCCSECNNNDSAGDLAAAHWDYIEKLFTYGIPKARLADGAIEVIGFHYRTAFIHGYKHGKESRPAPGR